jgi:multidrug efflux system outer membrane protein
MRKTVIAIAAVLLAGCSLAPPLETPQVDTPAAWKQALPEAERGSWKVGEPSEAAPRGEWWKVFRDPALDALEAQAIAANQNLAVAAARVKQARTLVGVAQADRIPQVNGGVGPYRFKPSGASQRLPDGETVSPYTVWRGVLTFSYEVDLFGRVGNRIDAARADAEGAEASFRSVLLALQADVAQTYFALRQTDAELGVLRTTVKLREDTVKLVQRRFDLGDISELDLAQAKTSLALTRNEAIALERIRAQLEHALAVLTGRAPASFDLAAGPLAAEVPAIPAGLPSALLERRPDIAAAQRAMAASNARIGVAKAAFFPSLTLTGQGGFESADLGDLFQWSSRTWLLGPLFGTILSMPLIDGGRNQANLDRAYAVLEESMAAYRQTVLGAFAEVEDQLVGLRTLAGQADAARDSVVSAQRAFDIANKRYERGASSFLEVIEAQRTLLVSQRLDVQVQGARAITTVALVRALGGGWDAPPRAAGETATRQAAAAQEGGRP